MLRLLLMRHSDAEYSHIKGDSFRALLPEGIEKARRQAQSLQGLIQPEVILHSPYLRAQQTAEIMAEAFGVSRVFSSADLVPSADDLAILPEISAFSAGEILLVGHNPHMSRLASRLHSHRQDVSMVTAMIAAFDFDTPPAAGEGTLVFIKRPGQAL